ncbi:hypothetical protein [Aurantiacibacter flavus]|uniref:LysR substrate-binding domain-containing protein n=1 Tax=Aurantiacibacter flavus TaxID=3145232 RepID=A0ABV0CU35_9SPHN
MELRALDARQGRFTPCEAVFEEKHVTVGWTDNPLVQEALDPQAFVDAGHIGVNVARKYTFADDWFSRHGIERRIELRAPSFIQAPFLLPGTVRLCIMHQRLARYMAERLPLRIVETPFPPPDTRDDAIPHDPRGRPRAAQL